MSDGSFETVFYEGHIKSAQDFLEAMQKPENVPVIAYCGTLPIGFAWLNGLSGSYGFGHFCFFKSAWGHFTHEAGTMIVDYWMTFPFLETILGTVPEANDHAIRFVQKLGFVKLGAIPNMLTFAGNKTPAVILYYSRSDHEQKGRRQ